MDAIETIAETDGLTVKLYVDEDAQSPDSWDNLATFEHSSGYTFGETIGEPERGWNVYIRALTLIDGAAAVLPVRLSDYGSSGIRTHETTPDDANAVLFTTHKRINELWGESPEYHDREWATNALRGELEVWNQYLDGDVYGYKVTDETGEHVDSCWGFYGFEYAKEEAREALEACVSQRHERRKEVARGWAIAHGLGE